MRKVISIFFICIYLISFTEAKEILKLPAFVEHYKEHKSENKDITVFKFIVLHYLSGSQKDKDYQEDMKLPFKTFEGHANFAFQTLPKQFNYNFVSFSFIEKKKIFFYEKSYSTQKTSIILRPPILG